MKVKEESEKVGLKLNIQKTKVMTSDPITSWQIDGETMETVADFIFWAPKSLQMVICSHEIKRRLLLGRKIMTNLDRILKSRDIILSTKVHLLKAIVFSVVTYGCENWTIKKAERRRIDAFELWCWRRCLRVPWTARRPNQFILKEIIPRCSLEGLMFIGSWNSNTLATLCKERTHSKRPWCRKNWGQEEKGTTENKMVGWHHQVNGHGFGCTPGVGDGQGGLACCSFWGGKESDMTDWTELNSSKK